MGRVYYMNAEGRRKMSEAKKGDRNPMKNPATRAKVGAGVRAAAVRRRERAAAAAALAAAEQKDAE